MIEEIFVEVFGCKRDELDDSTEFKDIPAWDSMTHMILITRLESEFDIQMTGDEIASLATVLDVRTVLQKHGIEE